ncbi:ATP-binding protein [Candidatus Bathyarchaeota archaeon]|nr:ATP-binding protein [Candidatus Bathyarchaeota archaeon]
MKIAVASGKGGTGKTSVAVGLALAAEKSQLLDCDVEEPNIHILLKPNILETEKVEVQVPRIDDLKCNYCGDCAKFCQFNALFVVGDTAMVFPNLCHSCEGCIEVCKQNAIVYEPRCIGEIFIGKKDEIDVIYGLLDIGEALAVPIISAIKKKSIGEGIIILDAPPGTACPLAETVKDVDYCILVTEPTPFGLHDLEIAVEVVNQLGVPIGVIVNFAGVGNDEVYKYCKEKNLPILMEIPFDRKIAELYSNGIHFSLEMLEWKKNFSRLLKKICEVY